jgi:hypothetical protein
MISTQTANLILGLSFDHNLCFRCPNESCKPIGDIYVSIPFQWYKNLSKPMGFDPWTCILKNSRIHLDFDSHNESLFGSVRVHSFTFLALFALPRACDVTLGPPSSLATLQPSCFGHKPKARVVTQRNNETQGNTGPT